MRDRLRALPSLKFFCPDCGSGKAKNYWLSSKAWLDDHISKRDPRGGSPGGRRSG